MYKAYSNLQLLQIGYFEPHSSLSPQPPAPTSLLVLGCLIIARPDLVSIIISYGIGIGCILFGIALGLSLIRSKVERNLQKSEQ